METALLLNKVSAIAEKHNLINQKTGNLFNIFEIAHIETDEVRICRVIYELISPNGNHYQGALYLKLFFEHVLKINIPQIELQSAKVFREYVVDKNRRIDLVIQTSNRLIPIEVKICANDQPNQCADYYKQAKNSNVYYLTRFGTNPSESSAKGLTKVKNGYKEITCISFSYDILNWLEKCVSIKETLKIAPIREIMLQLIDTICKFTNKMEEEKEMEICEQILKSNETLKAALDIESALPKAKTIVMKEFLDALMKEFSRGDFKLLEYDISTVENYYKPKSTAPNFSIILKKFTNNLFASFNVEIAETLYFYFAFLDSKSFIYEISNIEAKHQNEYIIFSKAVDNVMNSKGNKSNFTFFWDYIDNSSNENYNFKLFNKPCTELIANKDREAKRIFDEYYNKLEQIANLMK